MNSPRVIELPRRLEPISKDTFADRTDATVIELWPRQTGASGGPASPEPPRAA